MDIKDINLSTRIAGHETSPVIYSLAFRLGEGVPEKVELVMEQIGRCDLYWSWIAAKQDSERLASRETAPGGDGFFSALAPASPELAEANSRRHHAWQEIQSLIDAAQEYVESLGFDCSPS